MSTVMVYSDDISDQNCFEYSVVSIGESIGDYIDEYSDLYSVV